MPRLSRVPRAALPLLVSLLAGCRPSGPVANEILWDAWGVPHIYGRDVPAVFYGFGWAQMRSHGDLLLRLYGQARGRAAEYWGQEHLESDRWVRTVGIPGRARDWYAAQSPAFRAALDAFASGINAYARAHPDRIADDVEVVLPVDATDVLAHTQRVVHFVFVAGFAVPEQAEHALHAGSNTWAIAPARSASGHAMLLQNPHLPWSDLFLFYEAHVVAPGVDVYGTTLVGFPILAIAFNDRLGWSHTVNTYDGSDLYGLALADGGYRFDGAVRAFDVTADTVRVREAGGTLRVEPLTIRRSVHGPVVAVREDRAVALRVAGLDAPGMLQQWWEMGRAQSLVEFEAALRRLQVPMFNVMYADRDGHILYLFNGRVPARAQGDVAYWQGLIPGDTTATLWTDVLPYDRLPRVLDPATGWLQNANDPPWTSTVPAALDPADYPPHLAPQFMHFRAQRSARMLAEDSSITFEELLAYKHSTRMELADRLLDDLVPAARARGTRAAIRAADVLAAWDRTAEPGSRGAVLFGLWAERFTAQPAGGAFAVPWDPNAPYTTPDGLADPAAAVRLLEQAAAEVERRYGTADAPWGEAVRVRYGAREVRAVGAPGDPYGVFRVLFPWPWFRPLLSEPAEPGPAVVTGGDSYYAAIEFGDSVRARVLVAYGNATQPGSPHMGDQLELFARGDMRPVWRTREEIEAHLEARDSLEP
jgi:acyl-homoserine-lactone acylase